MGVNTNTVLRALRQLRDEGLLEFRRGRGITVAGAPERAAVLEQARSAGHTRPHARLPHGRADRHPPARIRLTEESEVITVSRRVEDGNLHTVNCDPCDSAGVGWRVL